MDFRSDNVHEVADPVIKAIIEANKGTIASYGDDKITKKANELLSDLFDKDIFSFLVSTGTAANSLSLSAITPPFGTIFCGDVSHIYLEECNAPEFFTNSAKLFPIKTNSGKISHEELTNTIQNYPSDKFDMVASSLSISQGTECGTIYTSDEIRNIVKIARNKDIKLHMDGARFSNVIAATDKNPADLTWKLGTDIMSFGTTKNGTLSAELIISFDKKITDTMNRRIKRSGHLLSKMRFLSAQIIGFLENNLWIELAKKANYKAKNIYDKLQRHNFIFFPWQTEINEIFMLIPRDVDAYLKKNNVKYHYWTKATLEKKYQSDEYKFIRLVTSFNTNDDLIEEFISLFDKI